MLFTSIDNWTGQFKIYFYIFIIIKQNLKHIDNMNWMKAFMCKFSAWLLNKAKTFAIFACGLFAWNNTEMKLVNRNFIVRSFVLVVFVLNEG